jgi:HlyD family secretion protein
MDKRNISVGITLFIVLGFVYVSLSNSGALGDRPTPTPAVVTTDFENLVTASGTLVPVKRADLSFKVSGQAAKVSVKPGDMVSAGDPVVELESSDLQATVAIARAQLALLKSGPTREEVAVAQAGVDNANAQLAKVRAGATAEDLAIAKAGIDRATAGLKDAQAQYDKIKDDPSVGMLPQSAALQLATQDYTVAHARYDQVVNGATAEDIHVAQSSVAVAQANLDRVRAGTRPEEITAAQARLDQAQAELSAATLKAPFAGTIASVNLKEGEMVSPGIAVITLGDLSNLRLETDDLSETSIARIKLGQAVAVTFEALPAQRFAGKVTYISPISSQKQGGTNYTVYVELTSSDPALRWGMTGHIEIHVQ